MGSLGDLFWELRARDSKLSADIEKLGAKAGAAASKSFGARFQAGLKDLKSQIGKGFLQGLGIGGGLGAVHAVSGAVRGVRDAIGDAIGAASDFEDQLRTINTVARLSDRELSALGDQIQDLSRETGKSTDDLTAGFYDLVSAGIPAEHSMSVLRDAAILATGALGTTAQTVDLLTSVINAYGMSATESARLTDIFAKAVEDGKVNAAELGASIATIAPIAAQAGVSIEEVAAGYALLTARGVPATEAATQMRSAIVGLLRVNGDLNKVQKQTGINFIELARAKGLAAALTALSDAVGGNEQAMVRALGRVEAYNFAVSVTGDNAGAFADELGRVREAADTGGVAVGQYKEKMDSLAGVQLRFNAAVQTLQQDLGALVIGPMADFVGFLVDMADFGPDATSSVVRLAEAIREQNRRNIEGITFGIQHVNEEIDRLYERTASEPRDFDGTILGSLGDLSRELSGPTLRTLNDWIDRTVEWGDVLGSTKDDLRELALATMAAGGSFEDYQEHLDDLVREEGKVLPSRLKALIAAWQQLPVGIDGVMSDAQRAFLDGLTVLDETALLGLHRLPDVVGNSMREAVTGHQAMREAGVMAVGEFLVGFFESWRQEDVAGAIAEGASAAASAVPRAFKEWQPALEHELDQVETLVTATIEKVKNKRGKGWHWATDISRRLSTLKHQFKEDLAAIDWMMKHPGESQRTRSEIEDQLIALEKRRKRVLKSGDWEALGRIDQEVRELLGDLKRLDDTEITLTARLSYAQGVERQHRNLGESGGAPGVRAAGGPVRKGWPYVVGEDHAEVFVPDRSGIIAADMPQLVRALRGSSGTVGAAAMGTATSRMDLYVHDPDGGLARAGIGVAELGTRIGMAIASPADVLTPMEPW